MLYARYGGTKPSVSNQNDNAVPVYTWDEFMNMSNETSEQDVMDRIKAPARRPRRAAPRLAAPL